MEQNISWYVLSVTIKNHNNIQSVIINIHGPKETKDKSVIIKIL